MKKFISVNVPAFQFVPEHKGAPYTMDGIHYMNNGERLEISLKHAFGLEARKDANTAFDAGSDIEEYNMSVKSGKATLTSEILGHDMDSSLATYFARTASTCWAWVADMDGALVAYIMNEKEFEEFTKSWANFNKEGKVRFKTTSGKMVKWFEERL